MGQPIGQLDGHQDGQQAHGNVRAPVELALEAQGQVSEWPLDAQPDHQEADLPGPCRQLHSRSGGGQHQGQAPAQDLGRERRAGHGGGAVCGEHRIEGHDRQVVDAGWKRDQQDQGRAWETAAPVQGRVGGRHDSQRDHVIGVGGGQGQGEGPGYPRLAGRSRRPVPKEMEEGLEQQGEGERQGEEGRECGRQERVGLGHPQVHGRFQPRGGGGHAGQEAEAGACCGQDQGQPAHTAVVAEVRDEAVKGGDQEHAGERVNDVPDGQEREAEGPGRRPHDPEQRVEEDTAVGLGREHVPKQDVPLQRLPHPGQVAVVVVVVGANEPGELPAGRRAVEPVQVGQRDQGQQQARPGNEQPGITLALPRVRWARGHLAPGSR